MNDLASFFREAALRNAGTPALLYRSNRVVEVWSYSQVWEDSNRVAGWLHDLGVEKGDRVVLWAANSPYWAIAYLGILRLGAIVVPLDVRSGADFARRVVEQTEPVLAFVSRGIKARGGCTCPSFVVEELVPSLEANESNAGVECEPDDIAELVFTQDADGVPKGAILTHANILAGLMGANLAVPRDGEFRVVSLLPLSQLRGQVEGLLLPLKRESSVYFLSDQQPKGLAGALKDHRPAALLLEPGTLRRLTASIEHAAGSHGRERRWRHLSQIARFSPHFLRRLLFHSLHSYLGGNLQFLVSSGRVSPDLAQKWDLFGLTVIQLYEAAETDVLVTTIGETGKPVPGVDIRLSEGGEVLVNGPAVPRGYWRNPRATEEAFEHGWLRTGDQGELDARGYLTILGRTEARPAVSQGSSVRPSDLVLQER